MDIAMALPVVAAFVPVTAAGPKVVTSMGAVAGGGVVNEMVLLVIK
jgi:hypothetical protein